MTETRSECQSIKALHKPTILGQAALQLPQSYEGAEYPTAVLAQARKIMDKGSGFSEAKSSRWAEKTTHCLAIPMERRDVREVLRHVIRDSSV